jgi:uncharacterized protein with HEPN domain
MSRDARAYVFDARERARRLSVLLSGVPLERYLEDETLRESVQWNIAVLGESLGVLRRLAPELASRVTDVATLVGVRNFLIHVYHAIANLPRLVRELDAILAEDPLES